MVDRIAARGADAWSTHMEAARLRDQGQDVIFLTVGDPDQAPPEPVIDATVDALRRHRTGYSSIIGYPGSARRLLRGFSGVPDVRAAPTTSS
jgi:arginine:pyruvate transaminase